MPAAPSRQPGHRLWQALRQIAAVEVEQRVGFAGGGMVSVTVEVLTPATSFTKTDVKQVTSGTRYNDRVERYSNARSSPLSRLSVPTNLASQERSSVREELLEGRLVLEK